MTARARNWKPVRHPLAICARKGWRLVPGAFISPRGTVFAARLLKRGWVARKRGDFELADA